MTYKGWRYRNPDKEEARFKRINDAIKVHRDRFMNTKHRNRRRFY